MTGFDAFWKAWPVNQKDGYSRKGAKAECLKRWVKHHHETQTETILKHVEWMKTTAAWLSDNGAYIPAPLVYLNQQRWDGAEIPEIKTIDPVKAWSDGRGTPGKMPANVREKLQTLRRTS